MPIRLASGGLHVVGPQASVWPYSSTRGSPSAWNQRIRSGWIAAAAVMRMCARSRPISWRIFAPTAASSSP